MNQKYFLTKDEVSTALDKFGGIQNAAYNLNMSVSTLYKIAKRYRLDTRRRSKINLTKQDLDPYKKGYSFEQIAAILGCSDSTVRNAFVQLGMKKADMRNKKETHWILV
jgi:transposase